MDIERKDDAPGQDQMSDENFTKTQRAWCHAANTVAFLAFPVLGFSWLKAPGVRSRAQQQIAFPARDAVAESIFASTACS